MPGNITQLPSKPMHQVMEEALREAAEAPNAEKRQDLILISGKRSSDLRLETP